MMQTIFNIYLFMSSHMMLPLPDSTPSYQSVYQSVKGFLKVNCKINENYIFILDQIETILKAATGF